MSGYESDESVGDFVKEMPEAIGNEIHQVCQKKECDCGRWHYILMNGSWILSEKYEKCKPKSLRKKP